MTEAYRDVNNVTVALGYNGTDTIPFAMDPITNEWLVDVVTDSGGPATALSYDKRDDNNKPTMYGVSSIDLVTLIPIRTDDNGYLLVTF